MQIDIQLSAKFARLSFVAAIMVLIQHMYAPYWSGWVETAICHGLVLWDVPYFFFAAGFFLFGDFESGVSWYSMKLISRSRSLLIPYVCWTFWGLIMALVSITAGLKPNTLDVMSLSWWFDTMGITAATSYAGHLWFFRRLMLFVILSPLIGWVAKRRLAIGLIPVFWLLYIFNARSASTWSNLSFFMLGAIVSFRREWLSLSTLVIKRVLPICMVVYCTALSVMPWIVSRSLSVSRCGEVVAIVLGLISFWGLYEYASGLFSKMDRWVFLSLFVYGLHHTLLVYVKTFIHAVLPLTPVAGVIGIFLSAFVMLAICLFAGALVQKHFPRLFAIINEGRVKHV